MPQKAYNRHTQCWNTAPEPPKDKRLIDFSDFWNELNIQRYLEVYPKHLPYQLNPFGPFKSMRQMDEIKTKRYNEI